MTKLDVFLSQITLGAAVVGAYQSLPDNEDEGGFVNTSMPVLFAGREIGTARIGAWVELREAGDEFSNQTIRRYGFDWAPYAGTDRVFDRAAGVDLYDLIGDEDIDLVEVEQAILDLATEADQTDYGTIYEAARDAAAA